MKYEKNKKIQTIKMKIKRTIVEKILRILANLAKKKIEYARDGLITWHTCRFMEDSEFVRAMNASRAAINLSPLKYRIEWRLHTALWVAEYCSHLDGDFVECGVNEGFLSRAIVHYVGFNKLDKKFYLLDTFEGLPLDNAARRELEISDNAIEERNKDYKGTYEKAKQTFKDYKNVRIIKGKVPDTLPMVKAKRIAYLSLDMNLAYPEIKAAEFFWDKMVGGGMILLDDYAYDRSCDVQRRAFDKFAKEKRVRVLTLASGQGLIIKPFKNQRVAVPPISKR